MNLNALAHAHIENLGKPVERQRGEIYAENVVAAFPFAPDGHTARLDGRVALMSFLAAVGEFTEGHRVEGIEVVGSASEVVMRYHEYSTFRSTGLQYDSPIVWWMRVDADHIIELTEYYNPIRVLAALDER